MSTPPATIPQSTMLTPQELADQLGESIEELTRLRRAGQGPDYIALSKRTIRYFARDFDTWLVRGELIVVTKSANNLPVRSAELTGSP